MDMASNGNVQSLQHIVPDYDTRQSNRLLVINGTYIQQYDLNAMGKDRILFGRDAGSCDIVIANLSVSRIHGKIKMQNGDVLVGDIGSTNGTCFFHGNQYEIMQSKKYYRKGASDFILRIEGKNQNVKESVVMIFTNSDRANAWQTYPIGNEKVTIGRDMHNSVVMETPSFSRRHAVIQKEGDEYRCL